MDAWSVAHEAEVNRNFTDVKFLQFVQALKIFHMSIWMTAFDASSHMFSSSFENGSMAMSQ